MVDGKLVTRDEAAQMCIHSATDDERQRLKKWGFEIPDC